MPPGGDADQREEHGDDTREQIAFGFGKDPRDRAPQDLLASPRSHTNTRPRRTSTARHGCARSAAVPAPVAYGSRNGTVTAATSSRRRVRGESRAACATTDAPLPDLPDDVGDHEWREEHQVVRAGQVLRDECRRRAEQWPPASSARRLRVDRIEESAESVERERHPLRRQHLQMRALRQAVRREREEHAGNERGARIAGDLAHEEIRAEPGEHERREDTAGCSRGSGLPVIAYTGRICTACGDEVLRVGERQWQPDERCWRRRTSRVARSHRAESRAAARQSQASAHMLRRPGRRDRQGTSRPRPRASGHVATIVSAR